MARTSLNLCSGAAQTKTLMEDLNPNFETMRTSPSSSPRSDFDPSIGETIVCAPFPDDTTEQYRHRGPTRSVSFDEVFQDGKSQAKRIIIQFLVSEGSWFILRCDEHDHDFKYPPLRGAGAHLRSEKHGWLQSPSDALIVWQFGIEVLNCNAELAEKNNRATLKADQGSMKRSIASITDGISRRQTWGSEQTPKVTRRNRTRVGRHGGSGWQRKRRKHEEIPDPIPGRIYMAYSEMGRNWLPALLLPHTGLEEFGIPSTLESLGLIEHLPQCYVYDPATKHLTRKDEYECGGPRFLEREFPVLYFDGNKFPDGSPADWGQILRQYHRLTSWEETVLPQIA
ncbi:hypothetical protein NCS52_01564800 [Fusarium sp. LHS14.1]|nr:hypothetical protein NCS52_01564800 [Fusarium sp. LHS14.1]